MIAQVRTAYRYFLIMGIGAVLFMFSVMVPVLSSSSDFSIYNTGWNGCSELGKDVYTTGSFLPTIDITSSSEERVIHNSFSELGDELDPGDSAIIIIGPDMDFESEEIDFIHEFLVRGGTLLLADDIGFGNTLLQGLNTSSRIASGTMIDLSYMKKGEFAVTSDISMHETTRNVSSLLLNHPSMIEASPRADPMINSSSTSWLDTNRNNMLDPEEREGPFPIFTIERYGKGELLLLSEPSLLINQMKDRMDNGEFVKSLISYISKDRSTIVIDESHRDLTNPVQLSNMFIADTSPGEKIGLLLLVTAIFLIWNSPLPRRTISLFSRVSEKLLSEKRKDDRGTDPVDQVMDLHPDWDRPTLQKIVSGTGEVK